MSSSWSLQDAKNRFSAVVDAALHGQPQLVTRHGRPVAAVLSAAEYQRLHELDKCTAPDFTDLLLAVPQDDGDFETTELRPYETGF